MCKEDHHTKQSWQLRWETPVTFEGNHKRTSMLFTAVRYGNMENACAAAWKYLTTRFRATYRPTACGWGPLPMDAAADGKFYHGARRDVEHRFRVEPGGSGPPPADTKRSFKRWDDFAQTFEHAEDYCKHCQEVGPEGTTVLSSPQGIVEYES